MTATADNRPSCDNPDPPAAGTLPLSADDAPGYPALICQALRRHALADARLRRALARRLALTDSEVLAVQYLARVRTLTPGQLAALLQLSSGGTTGLIQRLHGAGHITRQAHPSDRRSVLLRLTPTTLNLAADSWTPLVAEIEATALALLEEEQQTVNQFLQRAADAAERHAERLSRNADASAQDALAVAPPALWG